MLWMETSISARKVVDQVRKSVLFITFDAILWPYAGVEKCDTVKIVRAVNAGVEKAGVDRTGGKYKSGKRRSR